jgi:hypothetical protein
VSRGFAVGAIAKMSSLRFKPAAATCCSIFATIDGFSLKRRERFDFGYGLT